MNKNPILRYTKNAAGLLLGINFNFLVRIVSQL